MKTKISILLLGCLLFVACSEDFLTHDLDKSRYNIDGFYTTKEHADQALYAAYGGLNGMYNGYGYPVGLMHFLLGDEFYQTGNAAGFEPWGAISDFNILSTQPAMNEVWSSYYQNILGCNVALDVMPKAQAIAVTTEPAFTQAVLDVMMGQALAIRAFNYYCLYNYFPEDKIILHPVTPTDPSVNKAPATSEQTFAFIETDLKDAQRLLVNALNNTTGYDKGRATRGMAAALLGKLYMFKGRYADAAAEFAKILPGLADGSYGTYSLVNNYRDNFTVAGKNNSESVWEIQFSNTGNNSIFAGNEVNWLFHNFTMNRTADADYWYNFAIPTFKLDEYESWTEDIGGTATDVYDYRVYETFWGVPNGANYINAGNVFTWADQKWDEEMILNDYPGAYGLRKYCRDNTNEKINGDASLWDVDLRIIRLADVMLLYAECMANLNPTNVTATDMNSAVYWVDLVRTRANNEMTDQSHLYSARTGVRGQLPTATELLAENPSWTTLDLVKHERYIEGFGEGWRKEDLRRWKVGQDYVQEKNYWRGYQSLILPIPQREYDTNPLMPK